MLCFLLAMSPAARSSIYLFEQFDDTFLPNGWSVVGTDISLGVPPALLVSEMDQNEMSVPTTLQPLGRKVSSNCSNR